MIGALRQTYDLVTTHIRRDQAPLLVASDRHIDRVADLPRRDRCVTDHTAHTQCPGAHAQACRDIAPQHGDALRLRGVTVGRVDEVISRGQRDLGFGIVTARHERRDVCTRALLEDAPDQAGADRRACLGIACIQPQHTGLWQHRRAQALITRLAEPLQQEAWCGLALRCSRARGGQRSEHDQNEEDAQDSHGIGYRLSARGRQPLASGVADPIKPCKPGKIMAQEPASAENPAIRARDSARLMNPGALTYSLYV